MCTIVCVCTYVCVCVFVCTCTCVYVCVFIRVQNVITCLSCLFIQLLGSLINFKHVHLKATVEFPSTAVSQVKSLLSSLFSLMPVDVTTELIMIPQIGQWGRCVHTCMHGCMTSGTRNWSSSCTKFRQHIEHLAVNYFIKGCVVFDAGELGNES